jgi:hypothetical protein
VATETEVGELLHQRGWRTAFTLAERVNAWAALVSVIERGYSDDIYEYTNDLYCRNWLHEARLLLDKHIVQFWTRQSTPASSLETSGVRFARLVPSARALTQHDPQLREVKGRRLAGLEFDRVRTGTLFSRHA